MMLDRITPIVIDVETEPDKEWIEHTQELFVSTLKVPANYKKQDSIDEWVQTQVRERNERASLTPIDGRITAIGVVPLWGPLPVWAKVGRGRESELIGEAMDAIVALAKPYPPLLCGWHINDFDIPFIMARACVHSLRLPDWWPAHPRRFGATIDGADILREGKLATWLARLDLPAKLGEGKNAPKMDDEALLEYLRRDVECERALLQRLARVAPE